MTRAGHADLHGTVADRLRSVGQRYTSQREALVMALQGAGKPLSTAEIVAARTGPQSSVYRNLSVLEHAGVARRVITEGEFARFELAEDLTEHHHHLICSRCGKVQDVTIPPDLETTMDRAAGTLARRNGFATVGHRLDLIGTCRSCA
jgi:Fur family transcriptional regulator, ferric uptake regulator